MSRRQETAGGWLHWYALLVTAATLVLIVAGGMVTSTDSGLAVPDWPLSYGMLFPPMVGGIFYEHGHRMIAGAVGLMTAVLAFWVSRREARAWVRRLGWLALGTVVVQALLGGLTVIWLLPPVVSTSHLGTAMLFLAIVTLLAIATSPSWHATHRRTAAPTGELRRLALAASAAVYLQILLGAAMRHTGAGLACSDFPLCNGRLLPDLTNGAIALHMSHRVGALVVTALVFWLAERAWARYPDVPEFRRPALAALGCVTLQVLLGALSVISRLGVYTTTAHVLGGALLLCSLVVLTARAHRRIAPSSESPVDVRQVSEAIA